MDFSKYSEYLDEYAKKREVLIEQSRKVLTLSKKSIFRMQQSDDIVSLDEVESEFSKLQTIAIEHPNLSKEGMLSEAAQEYVEAVLFNDYLQNKKLSTPEQLKVSIEDYLCGVCDFTGELGRKAVQYGINDENEKLDALVTFCHNIYEQLLGFSFRNGLLRKKFDSVKWNVTKLQDLQYAQRRKN